MTKRIVKKSEIKPITQDNVTIPRWRYEALLMSEMKLDALEANGVENWNQHLWDLAMDQFEERWAYEHKS